MTAEEYLELGKELVLTLLRDQLAAPWMEVEARIADDVYPNAERFVEPHHLSQARIDLVDAGLISVSQQTTRGGRKVALWTLANPKQGQKSIDRAAARKRLLMARYLGWAQGTPSRPGITGTTAEQVVHAALLEAAPRGFTLVNPTGPGVQSFLGVSLKQAGALDSAVIRTELTNGLPTGFTAIPIEVKNLRDWIYPSSKELFQLLDKATLLQQEQPAVDMAPTLICRRAHITTMRMAKTLGFFVVPTRRQYISPVADEDKVTEIRKELGFTDLARTDTADEKIVKALTQDLSKVRERTAQNWKRTAADLGPYFSRLRNQRGDARSETLLELKKHLRKTWGMDFHLGW